MSLQDHLRIASAELTKAVDIARQEINELKSEEADLQKLVNQDIAKLTAQLELREREVNITGDTSARSQGQATINNLIRQIADAKNQLGNDRKRIQDAIREKESLINTLNQQVKSIQS